jgi:hypothetical protein
MFLIDQNSKEEITENEEEFSLTQFNNRRKVLKIITKEYEKDEEEPPLKR